MYYNSSTSPMAYTYNSSPSAFNSNDSLSMPYTYNSSPSSFNSNDSLSMSSSFSSYPYNYNYNYSYENKISSPAANIYYKPSATTYGYAHSTISPNSNSSNNDFNSPISYIPSNYYYAPSSMSQASTSTSDLNSNYQKALLNEVNILILLKF